MRLPRAALAVVATVCVVITAACSGGNPVPDAAARSTTSSASTTSSTTTLEVPPLTTTPSTTAPSTTASTSATESDSGPHDPLTGEKVSANPVIAVKIENTDAGMPQYGVSDADIIYTEQVEGGLVRLIAIFHTVLPKEVGAVRSVRSTDVELLPSFGAPILVYSGGATAQLRRLRDSVLIATTEGDAGFWRSKVKRAPYNLHANLQEVAAKYTGKAKAQPMGFDFDLHDLRLRTAPLLNEISVTMRNGQTSFRYSDGRYRAYFWDKPYVDAVGNKPVFVDNVVVQRVDDSVLDGTIDPAGNPSYLTKTIGSGSFTLYRDGRAITGTWTRAKPADPTQYLGSDGKPVLFKPGKTWVLLAPKNAVINKG
ncbi:MAG: DUF3048 domain-containing protein [Nakamurella sp.]